jgi:hypothetical protein
MGEKEMRTVFVIGEPEGIALVGTVRNWTVFNVDVNIKEI